MPPETRTTLIQGWFANREARTTKVIVSTPGLTSTGHDHLKTANVMVHFAALAEKSIEHQTTAGLVRPGQDQHVYIFHLLDDGLEAVMQRMRTMQALVHDADIAHLFARA
jgi:hypothetical protein